MMKALTVYHPWAELIALNEKRNETRGWATKYRGPIAIHCGTSRRPWHMDLAFKEPFLSALKPLHSRAFATLGMRIHLGQILAIGNLVDCLEIIHTVDNEACLENGRIVFGREYDFGDYTPGRFAWILENVHQLVEPIPAKGMQRLWNFDETDHLVSIDPFSIGSTKIWTPKGVISGRRLDLPDEDAVKGLEVA
jgi:hypothetical protein